MKQEARTEYLSVRLRPATAREVEAAAKDNGMSKSTMVRRLIAGLLERRRQRLGIGAEGACRPLPQLR